MNISKNLHPCEVNSRGLLKDSISFMGGNADMEKTWITPSVWRHLFNSIPVKSNRVTKEKTNKSDVALRPAGYITESGEFKVEYPWKVTYVEDGPETQADAQKDAQANTYEIQALDAEGNILASQDFSPTFFPSTLKGHSSEPSESDKFSLNNVSIPFPDGTVKFNFLKDNTPIKEILVSSHAPTITITMPTDGSEFVGSKTIKWTGNDLDGDKLYYTVEYSHNGTQWSVLEPDITDSQLTVDFSLLPGGEKAVIRVIASDGIHCSKSDSNTFKVPTKSPTLFVEDADISDAGVILNASAYDSSDGWIYDDRITWSSDTDGEIGKGSTLFLTNLSVGNHVVTITAENYHGQKVEKKISFTVEKHKKSLSGLLPSVLSGLPIIDNLKDLIFWTIAVVAIIIILLILIKILTRKKKCSKCGKKCKGKALDCPKCGYHLLDDNFSPGQDQPIQNQEEHEQPHPNSSVCPSCEKQNAPAAKFCRDCGTKL